VGIYAPDFVLAGSHVGLGRDSGKARLLVHQIEGSLIDGNGVLGRDYSDIPDDGRIVVPVTIAVRGDVVDKVDKPAVRSRTGWWCRSERGGVLFL